MSGEDPDGVKLANANGTASPAQIEQWKSIQDSLKKFLKTNDHPDIKLISRVAGLDISMRKQDSQVVCVTLVVLDYATMEVIYEDSQLETTTIPYVSGFLGFREAELYKKRIDRLRNRPDVFPQVTLVDGNGILHCNGFGSASHVGVCCDIPTIGVAKSLLHIPEKGIGKDTAKVVSLKTRGDKHAIKSCDNETLGMALITGVQAKNPVYVSVGHSCTLESAVDIVLHCSERFRIPEPIRQADIRSRQLLRETFPEDYTSSSSSLAKPPPAANSLEK